MAMTDGLWDREETRAGLESQWTAFRVRKSFLPWLRLAMPRVSVHS